MLCLSTEAHLNTKSYHCELGTSPSTLDPLVTLVIRAHLSIVDMLHSRTQHKFVYYRLLTLNLRLIMPTNSLPQKLKIPLHKYSGAVCLLVQLKVYPSSKYDALGYTVVENNSHASVLKFTQHIK